MTILKTFFEHCNGIAQALGWVPKQQMNKRNKKAKILLFVIFSDSDTINLSLIQKINRVSYYQIGNTRISLWQWAAFILILKDYKNISIHQFFIFKSFKIHILHTFNQKFMLQVWLDTLYFLYNNCLLML